MEIKNRLMLIVFFLIISPILAIVGFVITSLIQPKSDTLPISLSQDVNWFTQNPDLTRNIALILYILAAIFAVIGVYNVLASLFDSRASDEEVR